MTEQILPGPERLDAALLQRVIELCRQAGEEILRVYHRAGGYEIDIKADNSPVTEADLAAHVILQSGLTPLLDSVPLLSEESSLPPFSTRKQWQCYWIIDPLDGTKEFIKRNGEFTVNVALIEHGKPILGVVHVPVSGVTYVGVPGTGAYKCENGQRSDIHVRRVRSRIRAALPVELIASRRHGTEAVDALISKVRAAVGLVDTKSVGSSLKLCLIAEGEADLYPRLALTSEWDTAAAQAVVEAAGGRVVDTDFQPLRYNTKDDILNPYFYVIGDADFDWQAILQ